MNPSRLSLSATISGIFLTAALSGCGGGGGGSGGSEPPATPSPDPQEYVFEQIEPASVVEESHSGETNPSETVAILDTGIQLDHEVFTGQNPVGKPVVASRIDSAAKWCLEVGETDCGDIDDVADESGHGTVTAALVGGNNEGYSRNAQLAIYDVTDRDDGLISITAIAAGLRDAAENGNRIANLSFGLDVPSLRRALNPESTYGEIAIRQVEQYLRSGGVMVSAAGNESQSYSLMVGSSWDADLERADSMIDQYLVVGALSGDSLASYSNYAGENSVVQQRFLVTQGQHHTASATDETDGYGTFVGTSFAAPLVSAGMATILSKWDHLTPKQAAQHLLDTTERRFANENDVADDDYGDTSCGPSGDMDCGLYNYGQGRLDIEAALAPKGVPVIATTSLVPDAAVGENRTGIDESGLVLPAGLGDAGEKIAQASSAVEVFDELGRNYTADLSGMVQEHTDPTRQLGFRMSRFLSFGLTTPTVSFSDEPTGTRQTFGVDSSGRLNLAAVGTTPEAHDGIGVTAYHFGNGASAPDATGLQHMGMVSYAGNTPMANQIDSANGVNLEAPLAKRLVLTSSYWQGTKRLSLDETGKRNRMSNIAIGVEVELFEGVDLSAGYASLDESNGFMGMTGMGGFSTGEGSSMNLTQVGVNARFGGVNAFANYQAGRAHADFTGSLIKSFDADVEQMAVGASYGFDSGRKQIAFVASQPMHLTGGTAEMQIATDRTKDGKVIYRREAVDFSGANAPMNYELGYRQRIGKRTMVGFNAMRMENLPGRGNGATADHGAMALISLRL